MLNIYGSLPIVPEICEHPKKFGKGIPALIATRRCPVEVQRRKPPPWSQPWPLAPAMSFQSLSDLLSLQLHHSVFKNDRSFVERCRAPDLDPMLFQPLQHWERDGWDGPRHALDFLSSTGDDFGGWNADVDYEPCNVSRGGAFWGGAQSGLR